MLQIFWLRNLIIGPIMITKIIYHFSKARGTIRPYAKSKINQYKDKYIKQKLQVRNIKKWVFNDDLKWTDFTFLIWSGSKEYYFCASLSKLSVVSINVFINEIFIYRRCVEKVYLSPHKSDTCPNESNIANFSSRRNSMNMYEITKILIV